MTKSKARNIQEVTDTKLRQLITAIAKDQEKLQETKLSPGERAILVDNVLNVCADPLSLLVENLIVDEFEKLNEGPEDPEEQDEEEEELDEEQDEGDVIDADFEETED